MKANKFTERVTYASGKQFAIVQHAREAMRKAFGIGKMSRARANELIAITFLIESGLP